jgi:hypothetical protein
MDIKPQALSATFPNISQIFWVGNIKGEMCLEYSFLTHPDTQLLGCSYNLREVEYLLAFHALYA